ncbi:MAG: DUF21 domain-containing protein [Candidatus Omnitrophota bacterium]|nr:DUF21 domain-containing protein [Candidatus Omnitrophota bacterium]
MQILAAIGIALCLIQSALFSGLTLGLFGLSRLRIEIAAAANDRNALKILNLRKDANFLLTTLLWGNVSVNVLLTILTDSVMTGIGAFLFATVGITIFGEIVPQAYFSRHAAQVGTLLAPMIRFYEVILYPVAKPLAMLLDAWLGREGIHYFQEKEIAALLEKHIRSSQSDIGSVEGRGAVNFLALDDIHIKEEGEVIDPLSILHLTVESSPGMPVFPAFKAHPKDSFLQQVHASGKKWVILIDPAGHPALVLNANVFLRDVLLGKTMSNPYAYCHRPLLVTSEKTTLGQVIKDLKVYPRHSEDDVIDHDLILYWGREKRIITGADLLGRLLRGIASPGPEGEKIEAASEPVRNPGFSGWTHLWQRIKKGRHHA